MEKNFTMRTSLIIGEDGIEKLKKSKVIVFGVGGVGSFAAEAIARAGVGNLTIVDFDEVDITNINRQLPALHSTVGKSKVEVMRDRILDINPDINLRAVKKLYNAETSDEILCEEYDYVVDAIDMVTSKIKLIETCKEKGFNIISSMGMASKIRILLIERNMKIKDLAEMLGYSGNNLSNKLRDDNFSEKELRKIAELLDCDLDATFTMRDTGKIV